MRFFLIRAVLAAGLAGNLAITIYLVVTRSLTVHLPASVSLQQLMQWDASNAFGAAAFNGGWPIAGMGFLMDEIVSTCWAIAFALIYLRSGWVRRQSVLAGLLFGIPVMVIMLFLIVPMGHAQAALHTPAQLSNVLIAHTVFFGLPVALVIRAVLRPYLTVSGARTLTA